MLLRTRYAGLSGGLHCTHALNSHTLQHRTHERQPVVHARNRRRTAADEVEDPAAGDAPPQQEIVRSSRRGLSERRNNRITRTAQQSASPFDTLRQMNIVTTDENGHDIVDLSCLGRGEPHWYAVGVMENKETKYLERLAEVMDEYGVSFDRERLYTPPKAGDAAAAEEAAALLEENEVTAWIPSKTMMVYSHNTDKLVERAVRYGRGTGGAWLMLHMTLSPLLVDLVQETYYYLGWRHEQEMTARMLEQAGLLPGREDKDEVYKLPVPCTPAVIQQMVDWQYTEESEDLEQQRQQYYGIGGGSVFGELPSKAERLQGMERDAAGNIVPKRYTAGTYDNPSGWSEGGRGGSSSRGGRGGGSSRGGRGGSGQVGRDSWQQQQQQPLPWENQAWQQQGLWATAASSNGGWNNANDTTTDIYNRIGNKSPGNRNNNVGGSDPNVRLQQMDYMQEMGSGRYSGNDRDGQQQQQQQGVDLQQDHGKPLSANPRDDSVRLQQMDFMGEMGSGRYSDEEDDFLNPNHEDQQPVGFSGRSGAQDKDLGFKDLNDSKPQGAGYVRQKGLGGKGDKVRQRQMDYMQEMGSGRYSDEEDSDLGNWTAGRGRSSAAAAAARDPKVRHRQMDYMEEMGSERYSSASEDDDDFSDPDWKPSSGARGSSRGAGSGSRGAGGSSSSFLSDVAAAFEGYDPTAASFLAQQQQKNFGRQQQQGWQGPAGPGEASFMKEDNLSWGNDGDSAAAAAREQYNAWQKDEGSDQGLNNSFNLDDFGNDVLLQQLAQMPPVDTAPSKKGRGRAAAPSAAPAPVKPKASKKTKKVVGKASRNAAAKGFDSDRNLGLDGVGSEDEGFEQGWIDRMMSDGNDRAGLDDVMQE